MYCIIINIQFCAKIKKLLYYKATKSHSLKHFPSHPFNNIYYFINIRNNKY